MAREMSRRTVLIGAVAGTTVVGGAALATDEVRGRVRRLVVDEGPAGVVPEVPEGLVRLEQVWSAARQRQVGLWTAVPDGRADG